MHVHSKWNYIITLYIYTPQYMYCIERSVTSVLQELQGFVILHNTLQGEITSVVHELQGLTKELYTYSPVPNDTFPHAKSQVH